MTSKALTDEQKRIMLAALRRQLYENESGRWIIAGAARPDRRERERLQKRGLLTWVSDEGFNFLTPSAAGSALLRDAVAARGRKP